MINNNPKLCCDFTLNKTFSIRKQLMKNMQAKLSNQFIQENNIKTKNGLINIKS